MLMQRCGVCPNGSDRGERAGLRSDQSVRARNKMATATYIASPLKSFRLPVSDELHDQEVSLKRFKLTAGHRAANKRKSAAMGAPPRAQTKRTLSSAAVSGASPCQVPASDRASGRKCRLGALFPSPSMPRKDGPKSRPRAADVRSPETLNVPCASHDSPNHVHDIVLAQTASVEDLKSGCSTPKPTDAEQDGRPADEAADTPGLELFPGVAESEADAAGTDLLMERQARIAMLQSRMGDLLAARNDFAATDTRHRIVVWHCLLRCHVVAALFIAPHGVQARPLPRLPVPVYAYGNRQAPVGTCKCVATA